MSGDDERTTDSHGHIDESGEQAGGGYVTSNDGTPDNPSEPVARRPDPPDLPAYVLDPLNRQSPDRLDAVAAYAQQLAAWKRGDEVAESDGEFPGPTTTHGEEGSIAASSGEDTDQVANSTGGGDDRAAAKTAFQDSRYSQDPQSYDDVPTDGAYITIKEPKPGYRYFYWQWRDGDNWKNQYIGPVQRSQ